MLPGILALELIVLLAICSLGPGLLIAARLRFSPLEKLCAAFAASYLCIYLASFALFWFNAGPKAYWIVVGIFLAMGITGWDTAKLLWRRRSARMALVAFAVLLAWDFVHLALVRHYDGGDWAVDWREHYDRTAFFLGLRSKEFIYAGLYLLPARPPLMNLIAAFFCRMTGLSFESYSFCFLFLNAWAFVPCCLLVRILWPKGRSTIAVLAILFAMNPSIIENATMTVTKAMTAGFAVLGVCFYLRALRRKSGRGGRIVASALSFAAGILAHFSAGPYAAAVALHCLWQMIWRKRKWAEPLIAAGGAAALLASWFVWSILVFGPRITFLSNTTATGASDKSAAANWGKAVHNLFTSLVPHPLHPVSDQHFTRLGNWGQIHDYYFMMTQTTLPMMMGATGGLVVIGMTLGLLRRRRGWPPGVRGFWIWFVLFGLLVGAAVNPEPDDYGCAQVTLQALSMMGVTLLAAWLTRLNLAWFVLVLIGMAVDYGLGIYLHFDRQAHIFKVILVDNGKNMNVNVIRDPELGITGYGEFMAKIYLRFIFWGDHLAPWAPLFKSLSVVGAMAAMAMLIRMRARQRGMVRG
jgi:Dolichyl-phosphate-mannose-protein mannosyltransferase